MIHIGISVLKMPIFEIVAKENRKEERSKYYKRSFHWHSFPGNTEDKIFLEAPISTMNPFLAGSKSPGAGEFGRQTVIGTERPKIWSGLKDHQTKEESKEGRIWCS